MFYSAKYARFKYAVQLLIMFLNKVIISYHSNSYGLLP